MISHVLSGTTQGVEGHVVTVEVDIRQGFPRIDLVGLPGKQVKESVTRVRSAIKAMGYEMPYQPVTINLFPGDILKQGTQFDLAIAMGILLSSCQCQGQEQGATLCLGELTLQGQVVPVKGLFPILEAAKQAGITSCLVPFGTPDYQAFFSGMTLCQVRNLKEAMAFYQEGAYPQAAINQANEPSGPSDPISQVLGHKSGKRALEIAVTGRHHILMIGPPGVGKTLLAKEVPQLLPPMNQKEAREVLQVQSVKGAAMTPWPKRPFREVHHTITKTALAGGGRPILPGEISMAHQGVLFLDELTEFKKDVLNVLRQPLEKQTIEIHRYGQAVSLPARFLLVAAMNPCPCGYYPDPRQCRCREGEIQRYLNRVSGPILDRLGICIQLDRLASPHLISQDTASFKERRQGIMAGLEIQSQRFKNQDISYNSDMTPALLAKCIQLKPGAKKLITNYYKKKKISFRQYHHILKIARTIGDMEGSSQVTDNHIGEAISYRQAFHRFF